MVEELKNACGDCGHETNEPNGPCDKCGSYRIVDIAFVESHFGADWRKNFKEDEPFTGETTAAEGEDRGRK